MTISKKMSAAPLPNTHAKIGIAIIGMAIHGNKQVIGEAVHGAGIQRART